MARNAMGDGIKFSKASLWQTRLSPDEWSQPYLWSNEKADDRVLIRRVLVEANPHDLIILLRRFGPRVSAEVDIMDTQALWPSQRVRDDSLRWLGWVRDALGKSA